MTSMSIMSALCVASLITPSILFLWLYPIYRKTERKINDLPGERTLLSIETLFTHFFQHIPGISLGYDYPWRTKHREYEKVGRDALSMVAAWPKGYTSIWLADAAAIKEVAASRVRFPKPVKYYSILLVFGPNIVASEFHEWKKYRHICAPAFSDRTQQYVWQCTIKLAFDVFENLIGKQGQMVIDDVGKITVPFALYVISVAGFGRSVSSIDRAQKPEGHEMTFKEAIDIVAEDVYLKLMLPKFAFNLHPRFRRAKRAFDEMEKYILDMIHERQTSEDREERFDIFSSLLDANEDLNADGTNKLSDNELLANVYIFLLGGHEASAHTMSYTLAALAMYQDEQEILYQHIKSVLSDGRTPGYDDMPLLTRSMAVIYETLRMFPPVSVVPKYSVEDTTLTVGNAASERMRIVVPQFSNIYLHITGLHYNPRYWPDPYDFKPARFLGDWPHDAFMPFGLGARACIGRKFFETEAVAMLTTLVLRYKISIKEEPRYAAETVAQRKARIFASTIKMTLTPARIPLVFTRR